MKQSIFQKTEYGYETTISLPAWNAFFGKELELDVSIDEETVTNAHLHTFTFLQENQAAILNLLLSTLLEQYAELQELYGYEPEEMQQIMPDVTDIQAFRDLLSSALHLYYELNRKTVLLYRCGSRMHMG